MASISLKEYHYTDKNGKTRIIEKHKATVTIKGFPRTSQTFERKTDAIEWAQKTEYEYKHQRSFGQAHHRNKTLRDAIERYEKALLLSNPPRHIEVGPMLKWWGEQLGDVKLGNLTKDRISQQRDKLKTVHIQNNPDLRTLSNARVNRFMAALSRVLTLAVDEWEWIAKNPMIGMEKLPESPGRTRFLQPGELKKLLKAATRSDNTDIYAIIVLAITTGARRGEIERIRLKDIDLKERKILLPITKNKKPRILHLVEPAYSLVKEICDRPGLDSREYLFASPCGMSRPNSFKRAWKTTIKRSGITDFKFHDLRHTAASFLAKHGAGLHQISEILGHSSFQVTKRYVHLIEKNTVAIIESTAAKVFAYDNDTELAEQG